MPTINETGHAKNLANFQDLIAFCASYPTYNPSSAALTIAGLNTKYTDARTALNGVIAAQTTFNNAVNVRMAAFEVLKPLATRVVGAFEACGADAEKVKDAKSINKKLQGTRASKKEDPAPVNPGDPVPADNTISASQQSYDQQMEHFARLINLLTTTAAYAPNETDINLTGLATKLGELQTANADVSTAYAAWSSSRITRTEELYNALTGLVPTAQNVKKYVKSLFGATSQQYKQVNGIRFKIENK